MILELAIEGISLSVFNFKPFSNKRRTQAPHLEVRRLLEGGAYIEI